MIICHQSETIHKRLTHGVSLPGFRESLKNHSDPTYNLGTNDISTYLLRINLAPIFQVHR